MKPTLRHKVKHRTKGAAACWHLTLVMGQFLLVQLKLGQSASKQPYQVALLELARATLQYLKVSPPWLHSVHMASSIFDNSRRNLELSIISGA